MCMYVYVCIYVCVHTICIHPRFDAATLNVYVYVCVCVCVCVCTYHMHTSKVGRGDAECLFFNVGGCFWSEGGRPGGGAGTSGFVV